MKLAGSRVLISGAGSGLGRACAKVFSDLGARVAVTDLNVESAIDTVHQLAGAETLALELDVTSEESWAQAMTQMRAQWGGIDVLINNAGVATAGTVADSSLRQWQWVLDINLMGCVRGSRAAIPQMQSQGGGHIVNIASFAGIANPPAMASYNAAKAAVISLSETLRFELHPQIGVSVACPSFFKTDLVNSGKGQIPEDEHSAAPQMMKVVEKMMDRATVTAVQVARAVAEAVEQDRFLVIPHSDARLLWRLKRLSPELYFQRALKATAGFLSRR